MAEADQQTLGFTLDHTPHREPRRRRIELAAELSRHQRPAVYVGAVLRGDNGRLPCCWGKLRCRRREMGHTQADSSRCLDAFIVALNQASGGQVWYTSTVELQLTSLQLCEACRGVPTLRLTVERDVIPLLWPDGAAEATRGRAEALRLTRVPALRPRAVVWKLAALSMRHAGGALARVECLVFGDDFDYRVDRVAWPRGLRRLVFGRDFDRSVEHVRWPAALEELTFGDWFNKPIESVSFPETLRHLEFGRCFNQPVSSASFPASLEVLTFGREFGQPIAGVRWPASLRVVRFGRYFNQPIGRGVAWPASLQEISFGFSFSQDVRRFSWPVSLRRLAFGFWFNEPIDRATLPPSLERIVVGRNFDQPLDTAEWRGVEVCRV